MAGTDLRDLERKALEIRKQLLTMIYGAGGGHTGGSLSSVDILVSLFFHAMRYDAANAEDPARDRFILSKGHSVEGFYCVLARAGFLAVEELATYGKFGSRLYGHPTMKVPGVEVPTGALGHGLSVGVGMAIAGKRDRAAYRVYVLMGDGEQAEGSVWEAAMAASHYRLDNLVGIIDYNKLQISGNVDTVMRISSLRDRWESFGWHIEEVNGNSVGELTALFDRVPIELQRPTLVIANTVKGKGVSFMENNASWHHHVPTEKELERALNELDAQLAEVRA